MEKSNLNTIPRIWIFIYGNTFLMNKIKVFSLLMNNPVLIKEIDLLS